MPSDLDLSYNRDPVCPYCGHKMQDAWELPSDDGEADCGECLKPFLYSRHVDVTYSTSITAHKEGAK